MRVSLLQNFYRKLQIRFPDILFRGDKTRREIALTFDDGPHPRDTPQVLDMLAKHKIVATFFLIGQSVEQYPHLVKRIHDAGHQLAIHCYRHIPFPIESASTLKGHLIRSRNAIASACGISLESIRYVRPPYGFFNARILSLLDEWGYQLILWDYMPLHFIQPTQWTIKQIYKNTVPGSIIVLHDGNGHGTKVASIVDMILPALKNKFDFVTIDKLLKSATGETV